MPWCRWQHMGSRRAWLRWQAVQRGAEWTGHRSAICAQLAAAGRQAGGGMGQEDSIQPPGGAARGFRGAAALGFGLGLGCARGI